MIDTDRVSVLPELKELVTEATSALARLDINRLQELALSCEALTRMPPAKTKKERDDWARKAKAVRGDMAVFARVLEATRDNLKVMARLRALRSGEAGYAASPEKTHGWPLSDPEAPDGND